MRALWLANLLNRVLDACFICGLAFLPKLGVTGAAVATTIGRSIGVMYQLSVLFGGKSRVTVARRHLRLDLQGLTRLPRLSGKRLGQYFLGMASRVGLPPSNASLALAAVGGITL